MFVKTLSDAVSGAAIYTREWRWDSQRQNSEGAEARPLQHVRMR